VTLQPAVSTDRLRADLARFGLPVGGTVLVQASLRAVGWVEGGASALLDAVRDSIGPAGTVLTPTQTADNSTTTEEFRRAAEGLDPAARQALEDAIPAFEPATSPSYRMGRFAEAVRTCAGAVRSPHPQTSFAAVGPAAQWLMAVHDLNSHLGDRSPLGRLYEVGADIVLIGRSFAFCTGFHLAEYRRADPPRQRPYRCFVLADGVRTVVDFVAPDLDDRDFIRVGDALRATGAVTTGYVGYAETRVVSFRRAVDFAVNWMTANRPPTSLA
jgi:aminoglycoside 3-N-acetyltransferase